MKTIEVVNITKLLNYLKDKTKKEYYLKAVKCTFDSDDEVKEFTHFFVTTYKNLKSITIFNGWYMSDWTVLLDDGTEFQLYPSNVNSSDNTLMRIGNNDLSEMVTVLNDNISLHCNNMRNWLLSIDANIVDIFEKVDIFGYFKGTIKLTEEELILIKKSVADNNLLSKIEKCLDNIKYTY